MPKRVQMIPQRPWRADHPDAAIVARPSKWGNPYRRAGHLVGDRRVTRTRQECVEAYRALWQYGVQGDGLDLVELMGRDLACWCPLDQPCHADVLLEIANPGSGDHDGDMVAMIRSALHGQCDALVMAGDLVGL